jgi:hypothetical protein
MSHLVEKLLQFEPASDKNAAYSMEHETPLVALRAKPLSEDDRSWDIY